MTCRFCEKSSLQSSSIFKKKKKKDRHDKLEVYRKAVYRLSGKLWQPAQPGFMYASAAATSSTQISRAVAFSTAG